MFNATQLAQSRDDSGRFNGPPPTKPREDWRSVAPDIKALHMVGRTNLNMQPLVTAAEVDALREEYGTAWPWWRSLSLSQRIDTVATSILQADRDRRGRGHGHRMGHPLVYANNGPADRLHQTVPDEFDGWLSVGQAGYRARMEIPYPSIDAIHTAIRFNNHRYERMVQMHWTHGDTVHRALPIKIRKNARVRTGRVTPPRGYLSDGDVSPALRSALRAREALHGLRGRHHPPDGHGGADEA